MTLTDRINSVESEIELIQTKLQKLAQMQDQMIAEHNKLVGKLEVLNEIANEQTKNAQETEEQADEKNDNN